MKRTTQLFSLLLLALTLSTSSCKKDEDPKPATIAESLVGTWNLTSLNGGGIEFIPVFISSGKLTFKSDKTLTVVITSVMDGDETTQLTYSVDETAKTLTTTETDGTVSVQTIALDGTKLTLTGTETDGTVTILKATKQ